MAPLPLVALLLLGPADLHASSGQELSFGIEAARRGLWNEARFRFEKAVALSPEDTEALNNLAVAYEQQGDFEKARATYDKALRLDPGNLYVQQNYDLFREADDKRNRKKKKPPSQLQPQPQPQPQPTPEP
ncbi:MAG TPA: tetratricopeptide repeat protein [Vicinamibacteria bacterium]|jgi:Flp pilus assembly protein TadD